LQSNDGIEHIARKSDLTAQLVAADSDRVEVFRESLKQRACVTIAIEKYSQLLKAAAEKRNVDVELSCRKPELVWKYSRSIVKRLS
jgi:hypothetical protein